MLILKFGGLGFELAHWKFSSFRGFGKFRSLELKFNFLLCGFGFQVIDVKVSLLRFFVFGFCDNTYKFQLSSGFGFGIVFQNRLLSDLKLGLGFKVVHLEGPTSWGFENFVFSAAWARFCSSCERSCSVNF